MKVFEAAEVAAAPVYDAEQLLADEHLRARGTFLTIDDPDLGPMTVQAPGGPAVSETPGAVEPPRARPWEPTTTPSSASCSASTPTASPPSGPQASI